MSIQIERLLNNKINLPKATYYSAIIGKSPSQGARSPVLWNAVYDAYSINCHMYPFDVSEDNITNLLKELESDRYFVGGAIAVPFKINVAQYISRHAKQSNIFNVDAINCIFRDSDSNLTGINTDGLAARDVLVKNFGSVNDAKIIVLGGGGAGIAIANQLSSEADVQLFCRNHFPEINQSANGRISLVNWKSLSEYLNSADIVINCTSVGYLDDKCSPLKDEQFQLLKHDCFVFDIIYQPLVTPFLSKASSLGLAHINGLEMNLRQACLSFNFANRKLADFISADEITSVMSRS